MENLPIVVYGRVTKVDEPYTVTLKSTGEPFLQQRILMEYPGKYKNLLSFIVQSYNVGRVDVGDSVKVWLSLEATLHKASGRYFTHVTAYKISKI